MSRASKYLQTQLKNIEIRQRFASGQSRIPTPAERREMELKKKKMQEAEMLVPDDKKNKKSASMTTQPNKKLDYIRNVKKKPTDWAGALAAEAVEPIDELSKNTLGSYIKKASFNAAQAAYQAGGAGGRIDKLQPHMDKLNKRTAGVEKATDKLTKQMDKLNPKLKETWDGATLDSLAEAGKITPQLVKQGIGIARDKRYAGGNMTGAVKAMNKLHPKLSEHPKVSDELWKQNEEVEQVDEIAPMVAGLAARSLAAKTGMGTVGQAVTGMAAKQAVKKMNNTANSYAEEVEQVDEISKATLASYIPQAAHDAGIKRIMATDFYHQGDKARKQSRKDASYSLALKYGAKARKRVDNIGKAAEKLAKEETVLEAHATGDLVRCKKTGRLASVQSIEGDKYTVNYPDGSTETGAADWYEPVRKLSN